MSHQLQFAGGLFVQTELCRHDGGGQIHAD